MKTRIFFILLITVSTICQGQPYESVFGSDTTYWNYLTDYYIADALETMKYKAYGDTLIEEQQYRILFEEYLSGTNILGFVREDTMLGRMWFRGSNSSEDILIMDLNLCLNDTFIIQNIDPQYEDEEFIVAEIYTESDRKILELAPTGLTFIEGIGINQVFRIVENSGYYSELLCFFKDTNQLYQNPRFESCDTTFCTNIPVEKPGETIVFPNPANEFVSIHLENESSGLNKVVLYNINGAKMTSGYFSTNEIRLDLSGFRSGLYLMRINDKYQHRLVISR